MTSTKLAKKLSTQLWLCFCTSYKTATEAWPKISISICKIWSTCTAWQKLCSMQDLNILEVWKAQSLAFQSLMHSKEHKSEPFCSYLHTDIFKLLFSAFMPSHNVCNNFCFKSKYSSIAIIISIHTAPVLYTVMEILIQIPVSNSVTSSQPFFCHSIIYP